MDVLMRSDLKEDEASLCLQVISLKVLALSGDSVTIAGKNSWFSYTDSTMQ